MSFVWGTGTVEDDSEGPMTRDQVLVARIIVTLVLSLGLVYLGLMIATLRRYGEMMDRAWHQRILGWINDSFPGKVPPPSEKVNTSVPFVNNQPVAPFSVPSEAPVNVEALPFQARGIVSPVDKQTTIDSHGIQPTVSTSPALDATDAVMSSGTSRANMESRSLPPDRSEQLLHWTEAEGSENRFESPSKIRMTELYNIPSPSDKNIDIKRTNPPDSNDKVWNTLPPDLRGKLEADLHLSWDADSPESILPILNKFNQGTTDMTAGRLVLCQKFRSDESKYAIFFFASKDRLPHDRNCYDYIPYDLDRLEMFLSPLSAPSSSLDPEKIMKITKISLPSKRWIIISQNSSTMVLHS